MSSFASWVQRHRFSWREFFILVMIGALANVYFLTNYSPSIDDELAAVRSSSEVWISQGRFTIYLLETLLFPQASIPFSPYLFFVVMMALTQMLLVRAHGMMPSWRTNATFCLFITYPTWWLIEEFSANVPAIGVGFFLVAAAMLLQAEKQVATWRHFSRPDAVRLLAIGLLLALSAGAYQTLLVLFACATIGMVLCRSIESTDLFSWRQTFSQIFFGALCVVIGAALYFVFNKLAMVMTNTPPDYIGSFIRLENLKAPYWLVGSIAMYALNVYSGATGMFGAAMPAAAVALICAAVAVTRARARTGVPHLLLFLVLLGAPFLLLLVTGPGLPLRAMVALPYVIWLSALLTLTFQRGAAWIISLLVFAVFQLQIINLTSQYIVTATMSQQQDRAMGFEIGRRMLTLRGEDSVDKPIWLDTYGYDEQVSASLYARAETSTTSGSFFKWDFGNPVRISAYLRVLGFGPVRAVPPAMRSAFTKQFEEMPVWPQEGALRRSGDFYLLKLGKTPGAAHGGPSNK